MSLLSAPRLPDSSSERTLPDVLRIVSRFDGGLRKDHISFAEAAADWWMNARRRQMRVAVATWSLPDAARMFARVLARQEGRLSVEFRVLLEKVAACVAEVAVVCFCGVPVL